MFREVIPPIIRSTYNCNYSVIAEGTTDGPITLIFSWLHTLHFRSMTSARRCNYSYMFSWWWVELPPETCKVIYRNIINCTQSHLVGQLLTLWARTFSRPDWCVVCWVQLQLFGLFFSWGHKSTPICNTHFCHHFLNICHITWEPMPFFFFQQDSTSAHTANHSMEYIQSQ